MRRPVACFVAFLLALPLPSAVAGAQHAQPPPGTQPGEPADLIGVTAAEVAVDFVVRDKKGRIVRDLKPGDLEVLEDGVRQTISMFQLVSATPEAPPAVARTQGAASAPPPPAPAAPAAAPDVEREAFVALTFDRLSPVARRTAQQAALEWLKLPAVQGREVGVFTIDQGLDERQPFTDDRGPVMDALEDIGRTAPTQYRASQDRERLRSLRHQLALLEGRVVDAAGPASAADSPADLVLPESPQRNDSVLREVSRRQMGTEIAMLQALESLERDQQGLATTNGLLALVNGLRTLPGRKAVVFFSEGLALPERVVATLTSVISEANRSGVSFYAVDAAGLRTRSAADETRRELTTASDAIGGATILDNTLGGQQAMTRMIERSGDVLRMDPASGLGALARETGGFLVRDTNDIALGLRRVEEELGAYYLLSYAPSNESWDGHYRRIELRARRPGLTVQARRGYYAVRTPTPTPVLEHEAAALASLERSPNASELAVAGATFHFPAEDGGSVVAIMAELSGSAPSLVAAKDGTNVSQDFTVLALVRNANGRVVHKSSEHYTLSWPKSKTLDLGAARVLFEREALLPPGRYTVETVAFDALGRKSGVHRERLVVPSDSADAPRLSSLVIVGHTERRALREPGPLQHEGMQLFPTLGAPLRLPAGKPLAFTFTLRPGPRPLRSAEVELSRGDEMVTRSGVTLPRADESGQIRVVGGLPVDGLEPGEYTLRLVVNDGKALQSRTANVTLAR